MTSQLHHVALGAQDVERVARFYGDVFALPELARHRQADGRLRSIWLGMGDTILMIERAEEPNRTVVGIGAGPFLLAFRVEPARRAELEATLAAAGYPLEGRTPFSTYTRDPEGNRVALSHYPLEAGPRTSR